MDHEIFRKIKNVYRFFSFEDYNFKGLEEGYLWCSKVEDFNDPFENFIKEGDFDLRNLSKVDLVAFLESNQLVTYQDPSAGIVANSKLLDLHKLVESRYEEIIPQINKAIITSANMLQNKYFHCLSHDAGTENPLSERLLWSHYASGLRGFVIEYDLDRLLDCLSRKNGNNFIGTHLIDYVSSNFESFINSCIENGRPVMINDFLFTKHVDWNYENEIRLISASEKLDYSIDCMKRIVVGEKMSKANRQRIFEIVHSKGLIDRLFTAYVKRDDISIQLREFNEKTNRVAEGL